MSVDAIEITKMRTGKNKRKKMDFPEVEVPKNKPTALSLKLDEITSWVKTKYLVDKAKNLHLYDEYH